MDLHVIEWLSVTTLSIGLLYAIFIACSNLNLLPYQPTNQLGAHANWKNFGLSKNIRLLLNIAVIVIASRLAIFCITELAYFVFNDSKKSLYDAFTDTWYRWDSVHYMKLAVEGYAPEGRDRFLLVFYPLYPLLIHIMMYIIPDPFWAGLAVSNICLILSCFTLFKIMMFEFHDESLAWKAVKYLLIYPFSFFTAIVYTESLFILMSLSCFYFMRKGNFLVAGIYGLLTALTRNHGVLLLIPMTYEILHQAQGVSSQSVKEKFHYWGERAVALFLIPMGIIIYLMINKWVSGDWLRFLDYQQENWNNSFSYFATNIANIVGRIDNGDIKFAIGTWLPSAVIFFAALGIILYSIKRLPISYIAYSFAYLVISYSPSWLLSAPRYMLALFPLFMGLALLSQRYKNFEKVLDIFLVLLLALYSMLFFKSIVF